MCYRLSKLAGACVAPRTVRPEQRRRAEALATDCLLATSPAAAADSTAGAQTKPSKKARAKRRKVGPIFDAPVHQRIVDTLLEADNGCGRALRALGESRRIPRLQCTRRPLQSAAHLVDYVCAADCDVELSPARTCEDAFDPARVPAYGRAHRRHLRHDPQPAHRPQCARYALTGKHARASVRVRPSLIAPQTWRRCSSRPSRPWATSSQAPGPPSSKRARPHARTHASRAADAHRLLQAAAERRDPGGPAAVADTADAHARRAHGGRRGPVVVAGRLARGPRSAAGDPGPLQREHSRLPRGAFATHCAAASRC